MNSIEKEYARIERFNLDIHETMRNCGLTIGQMQGGLSQRKRLLVNALQHNQKYAIDAFGKKFIKTFTSNYHAMNDIVERNAIILLGSLDATKERELQNLNARMKEQLFADYGIPNSNYSELIMEMVYDREYISRCEYPEWMRKHTRYPIATFIVMNKARNFTAHSTTLDAVFARSSSLKRIYHDMQSSSKPTQKKSLSELVALKRTHDDAFDAKMQRLSNSRTEFKQLRSENDMLKSQLAEMQARIAALESRKRTN